MVCERCGAELHGKQRKFCSANCRKRASDDRDRARCSSCGRTLAPGSGRRGTTRCRSCAGRAQRHEAARELIVGMWRDGASLSEIAASVGITRSGLGATMRRMRVEGCDLPLRHASKNRKVAA